jgi:hypothetical protein
MVILLLGFLPAAAMPFEIIVCLAAQEIKPGVSDTAAELRLSMAQPT